MDRAVLRAYGWNDIPTECEFLLDYEIDEEEWGNKRKPYRYRWPDDVRDEVLARLVALNGERAAAERRSGASGAKRGRGARRSAVVSGQTEVLLVDGTGDRSRAGKRARGARPANSRRSSSTSSDPGQATNWSARSCRAG